MYEKTSNTAGTSSEHHFYAANGAVLKNIADLAHFFGSVDDETYRHHVQAREGELSNDFSSWVRDVFGEHELAERLQRGRNMVHMQSLLNDWLVGELR